MHNEFLLLPVPQKIEKEIGFFQFVQPLTISLPDNHVIYKTIVSELNAKYVIGPESAKLRLLPVVDAPVELREWAEEPEGYAMVIGDSGVRIWASQASGHLYGAMTLKQLIRQFGDKLPFVKIGDKPAMQHRGAMLCFSQGHMQYRSSYVKHYVSQIARWKINALYLYFETNFEFPSLPYTAGPGAMKPSDVRELEELCRAYNIQLIPQLNLLAHCGEILATQRYQHLVEYNMEKDPRIERGYNLCPSHPEVGNMVEAILNDVFDCFSSDIVHVGGDEVTTIGECPMCFKHSEGTDKMEFYTRYFSRIKDIARSRGRKIGIWGDMLLHHYKDSEISEARKNLAPFINDTVIYDWKYEGGSPDTVKFFMDVGFQTIVCSASNLVYTSSLWPYQAVNQRMLFSDGIAAGAYGGMTTEWCNFTGAHTEQYNYLFASGGTALWSGPEGDKLARGLTNEAFERSYCLQRYNLKSTTLTQFWHVTGDAKGSVLQALSPWHGPNLRKCLYHTDNVLTFWKQYSYLLRGNGREIYRDGVRQARELWDRVEKEIEGSKDPYINLHVGPLLTHEHLLKRYEMTEALYEYYNQAAGVQFEDVQKYKAILKKAAGLLLRHLDDFLPIEEYLHAMHKAFGHEVSSLLRVKATKKGIKKLADFLNYMSGSKRPLPAFIHLHDVFLEVPRTNWFIEREHDWATGPARFKRYSIQDGPWSSVAADAERE